MNFTSTPSHHDLASTNMKMMTMEKHQKQTDHVVSVNHGGHEDDGDDDGDPSLSLRNLSKIILPPLGVSSYNQNQIKSKGWIISPMDSRYRCWESFMVVLVAYSAWVYPFEAAFLNSFPNKSKLYIVDNIVDLFFAIDIVLTFFLAYIDSRTHLLVRDRRKIAIRYLSTWFLMDVASTIPFEALGYLFTGQTKAGLSYFLLGLLRFWRLRRVKQLFTRLEKDIRFSYFWVRCARLLSRNSVESASNFVHRNRLPTRLKDQILAYMCLRFKAESLNQQQLIEQLPKSICKSICQHLFLPTVEKVYLFNCVSREILLLLVAKMKAEYIPPREDVIMQNEPPDDVYIIVSGEVEIIDSEMEKDRVVGSLHTGDMFGEVGALCCRPQSHTFRTKMLSQLLRLKTSALLEAIQTKQDDNIAMINNFLQHHKKLKDLKLKDLGVDKNAEEDIDPNTAFNLLTVAGTGNAAILDDLLKAKWDPDIGDSQGRTALHEAASKGHEECVLVLLKHACNVHLRDMKGNTALWDAISWKHHAIFRILYHCTAISDPYTAGDLLCMAAKRNDLAVMRELLKQGLNVDAKDRRGLTAYQIALTDNNVDMINLLVMNGADVVGFDFHSVTLSEKREAEMVSEKDDNDDDEKRSNGLDCARISIYRGHPLIRKSNSCKQSAGKLIKLPNSIEELKEIAGEKFGFDAKNTTVTNEEGAEIDSTEVIRDNDKLFIVEEQEFNSVIH
ncbi:potassium channel AKT2/3 [Carica papaya]|uniref:potassium channel AKT2/3 n=1 Tax=Carica papaya TaxID=3649 RepID=UPI000B8D1439|nr:potassium channel AKT2/3 [Carica papaya]